MVARRLVEMGVDMIWLGDDVGGQASMVMSPALWRRFLKPKMARLIEALKAINPELKVAYHSDGAIHPIIQDLVEIGLDVLNRVPPMDNFWAMVNTITHPTRGPLAKDERQTDPARAGSGPSE